MTRSRENGGLTPSLTAADLVDAIPRISEIADVAMTTLLAQPSASMGFGDVLAAIAWARA